MEPTDSPTGEVHAHISSDPATTQRRDEAAMEHPDKGLGMSGKFTSSSRSPRERARDVVDRMHDRADDFMDAAEDRTDRIRDRLSGAADRASRLLEGAEDVLHRRTPLLEMARQNPLPALGLAFAAGFLLAGSGEEERHPSIAKAKNQVKGAIMGGISAAISQQLRSFIEEQGGIGNMLASIGVPVQQGHGGYYGDYDDEPEPA